ncbi:MAG: molybdopterin-dependent oxidoreductase, partial [Acidimicrobiia bacterium]
VTSNDGFYRVDVAVLTSQIHPDAWRLRVTGMVDRPYELSFDELLRMSLVEEYITLACVSNEVGGALVGNARWLGVPLRELLTRARVQRGATQIVGRSVDGFTTGFPTKAASDGRSALVAVGMNGEPLPILHGFPARLVVAGLYGSVSATKWLEEIELTTFDAYDAYWARRGWAARAPVETQARIDVPRDGRSLTAGTVVVAGVAWAPARGIAAVEIQVDDNPWAEAELASALSDDSWRQWRLRWDAQPGRHILRARATDGDGRVQTGDSGGIFPDGATGRHTVQVKVR